MTRAGVCLVTLLTWRSAQTDDAKWKLTCVSHETEMFIIRNRLEQLAAANRQDGTPNRQGYTGQET